MVSEGMHVHIKELATCPPSLVNAITQVFVLSLVYQQRLVKTDATLFHPQFLASALLMSFPSIFIFPALARWVFPHPILNLGSDAPLDIPFCHQHGVHVSIFFCCCSTQVIQIVILFCPFLAAEQYSPLHNCSFPSIRVFFPEVCTTWV